MNEPTQNPNPNPQQPPAAGQPVSPAPQTSPDPSVQSASTDAAAPVTTEPVTAEPVVTPQVAPAQTTTAAQPAQPPQQSGSKLPLLLGILLVTIVAAAGAWWYLENQAAAEPVIVQEIVQEEAPTEEMPAAIIEDVDAPPATGAAETSLATESAGAETEVRTIAIEAGSYYYAPAEIRVQSGETVRLEMTSSDMVHNLVIEELGVSIPMTNAGETNAVEFTVDEPGTYTYYCGVDGHREAGQVGQLIVE